MHTAITLPTLPADIADQPMLMTKEVSGQSLDGELLRVRSYALSMVSVSTCCITNKPRTQMFKK